MKLIKYDTLSNVTVLLLYRNSLISKFGTCNNLSQIILFIFARCSRCLVNFKAIDL